MSITNDLEDLVWSVWYAYENMEDQDFSYERGEETIDTVIPGWGYDEDREPLIKCLTEEFKIPEGVVSELLEQIDRYNQFVYSGNERDLSYAVSDWARLLDNALSE